MSWKIIEIESQTRMNLFLDNIVLIKENDKIIIPIRDIDVLLINNYKSVITIQLINALAQNNTLVIVCDNHYLPNSYILPIIGNYNTLKIVEKQINWNHKWKAKVWKDIIKLKIINQRNVLEIFNKKEVIEELNKLINEIKEYDISNREGHASKIYWHALYGKQFKRFNDDYVNKLLNYGYTILRGYFTRSIIKKGLDPRISIFHKSFHNYFALASDLMEPFRIIVDLIVYKINASGETNFHQHKQDIIEEFNNKISLNGKFMFINNAIDHFVDLIISQNILSEIKYEPESL
ncbi:MAG: type II CRISPR-associated endonuclease Cas1 [Mycoplasmoidaceae bacterium]